MKTRYYLPVLLALLMACSDENESNELSAENASDQINSIASEMNGDVVTLVQSEGIDGALTLVDFVDNSTQLGRVSPYQADESASLVMQKAGVIAHYFTYGISALLGEEPDFFIENKGVWEWNFDLDDFERVDDAEAIIIRFPSEGSMVNNAEFGLTEVEVVYIDEEELPTSIQAYLTVDEVKYIDLDFLVNYTADGFPETADISLDVLPFSLEVSFDDTQVTLTSLAATLLLEGENLIGVDVDVEFESEAKVEPILIAGEVSYRTLRIVGSVSNTEMDNSEDSDPNDYVDLALFIGDEKVGDIVFELEEIVEDGQVYEEYIAYVEYADGTRENLEDIFAGVIDEIETTFDDIG